MHVLPDQLKKNMNAYEQVFSCARDALCVLDMHGLIISCNDQFHTLFSPRKDVVGHAIDLFVQNFFGVLLEHYASHDHKSVFQKKCASTVGITVSRTVDCSVRPVVSSHNEIIGFIVGFSIVRSLYDGGVFQRICDTTQHAIGLFDAAGYAVYVNVAYASMHGCTVKEVIGKHIAALHDGTQKEKIVKVFESVQNNGRSSVVEIWHTHPDGSSVPFQMHAERVTVPQGDTVYVAVTGRVIADALKMQETVLKQQLSLEHKNIALRELLAQLEGEREHLQDNVRANAEKLLMPLVEKMQLQQGTSAYAEIFEKNVKDLTVSFARKLTDISKKLTPKEIEVCSMIRHGLSSKEAAKSLHVSVLTVEKHRINIRKKLGLSCTHANLASFLQTL